MLTLREFENLTINIFVIPKTEAIEKLINRNVDIAFYALTSVLEVPTELKK